jgi:hypothetical protein
MRSKAAEAARPGGRAAVTAGYVLYPFQSEVLPARETAEAGKLAAGVLLISAAAAAAAHAHGDFVSFAAESSSPLARLRRVFSSRPSTAQCVARWLSSTPTAGASLVTAIACAVAIPMLLRSTPLRFGRLPRLATAAAKAAAFYAAVWLSLGRAAATVLFLRQLMIAARHAAADRGLALRRAVWQAACLLWLCRALGVLDMDLLPFIDLPSAWMLFLGTAWIGTPVAGFFQLYLATNAAASAWRAPLATLGVIAACAVAFGAAAAACDALCGANVFGAAWRSVGGDATLRGAWDAANSAFAAAAAPLHAELSGWYDMAQTYAFIQRWMPTLSATSGASASTWLGRAAGALLGIGGSARERLAARGARAVADIARDNALFLVAFHLAKYRSAAALRKEVVDALQLMVIGGVLLAVAIAIAGAGAADSDWVHVPCFLLGLIGVLCMIAAVLGPFVINPYELL